MTKMPRLLMTASASGVVGPLAPSAMTRTFLPIFLTVSALTWFSSAQGRRMSTSCSIQASPGSRSYSRASALALSMPPKRSVIQADARLFPVRVGSLVVLVPARHGDDLAAELGEELDGVLRDVAEALNGGGGRLELDAHLLEGLADRVDEAVAGGLGPAERTAHAHGLAGDEAGVLGAVDGLELVEHPEHVLGVGHDVGGRDVTEIADVVGQDPDPAAAEPFLLARAEVVRVADDAALAAAEGDVHDGTLPGHPHGQGPDGVDRLLGVEADASFAGPAGVVVLATEALEDADAAVVHADGDGEMVLPQRLPQEVPGGLVELEKVGHRVELLLGHLEGVEPFYGH
jgi:hypothetical protein